MSDRDFLGRRIGVQNMKDADPLTFCGKCDGFGQYDLKDGYYESEVEACQQCEGSRLKAGCPKEKAE
jgi:hypothetical protein